MAKNPASEIADEVLAILEPDQQLLHVELVRRRIEKFGATIIAKMVEGMADSLEVMRLNYTGQKRLAEQRAQTLNTLRDAIGSELLPALSLFTMPDGDGFMPEAEDVIEGFLVKYV